MSMDDEELAREFGLYELPKPRVDVPKPNKPIPRWWKPSFLKALTLVDQIDTWAFERFIPSVCVIDPSIDVRSLTDNLEDHAAVLIRTDQPPPSNDLVWRATGVKPTGHPDSISKENFLRWLGVEVANEYRRVGARKMGVPLVYSTQAPRFKPWIVPYIGAICRFDRTPPDGMRKEDLTANIGVMVPTGTKVMESHRVTPVILGDDEKKTPA
jgi:hypothetical protein